MRPDAGIGSRRQASISNPKPLFDTWFRFSLRPGCDCQWATPASTMRHTHQHVPWGTPLNQVLKITNGPIRLRIMDSNSFDTVSRLVPRAMAIKQHGTSARQVRDPFAHYLAVRYTSLDIIRRMKQTRSKICRRSATRVLASESVDSQDYHGNHSMSEAPICSILIMFLHPTAYQLHGPWRVTLIVWKRNAKEGSPIRKVQRYSLNCYQARELCSMGGPIVALHRYSMKTTHNRRL